MSLERTPTQQNETLLEKPDSWRATPESKDRHRPQAPGAHFEQRARIIHPAWPYTVTDFGVDDFPLLVRKDI
jgi:hypothetical protein